VGRRIIDTLIAENLVLAIITINIIINIALGFPAVGGDWETALIWADLACLWYFVLEIILKIYVYGWKRFWSSGMNRFDFFIVLASCPTLIAPFAETQFSALLALRSARLIRLLRILRFVPDAARLWAGVSRALRASVGLILALLLYNLILGLMACHLFQDVLPAHFGDPIESLYTLFKAFTIEGWYEIPDAIAAARPDDPWMGTLARGFFVVAVISGGLLGLSIVNAVLVDEMVQDNQDELEREVAALRALVEEQSARQTALLEQIAESLPLKDIPQGDKPFES